MGAEQSAGGWVGDCCGVRHDGDLPRIPPLSGDMMNCGSIAPQFTEQHRLPERCRFSQWRRCASTKRPHVMCEPISAPEMYPLHAAALSQDFALAEHLLAASGICCPLKHSDVFRTLMILNQVYFSTDMN